MKVKLPYDSFDEESVATGLECKDASLAQQHMAEEADINTIVRRFGITGQLPEAGTVPLVTNGDFVESMDFRDALAIIRQGQESFDMMTAEVRTRFRNDPSLFVDFCSDPANLDEMVKLGLAVEKPKAPVVPETPKA